MAYINLASAKTVHNRYIGRNGFKGVDFSSAPAFVASDRFSDAKNVYKDYKNGLGACVETFPGYRKLTDISNDDSNCRIYDICSYKGPDGGDRLAVSRNLALYILKLENNSAGVLKSYDMGPNEVALFSHSSALYVLGNGKYQRFAESESTTDELPSVVGYIPVTYIDGEPYEQKNMLTNEFVERYYNLAPDDEGWVTLYLHERVPAEIGDMHSTNLDEVVKGYLNITSVTVNGKELTWYGAEITDGSNEFEVLTETDTEDNAFCSAIKFKCRDGDYVVEIRGKSTDPLFTAYSTHVSFSDAHPGYDGTAFSAIAGCTIVADFDGRTFLTGNPALPNTIFYSSRTLSAACSPEYFGVLNYITIASDVGQVTGLVPTATSLAVLTSDASPTHLVGVDTGENLLPRIYTQTNGLPGVGCLGASCNFLDDVVFTTRNGIMGIDKQAVNLERTIGNRSTLVNGRMLLENMENAMMVEWEGYLCVIFRDNGHMYMADSRQITSGEYEWYYIDSLGSWSGDYPRYIRTDNGAELSKDEYDARFTDNGICYITAENGEAVAVEPDGSMIGGTFSPATVAISTGDLLIFGTEQGKLLVVNNDKRGVPSADETRDKGFDEATYKAECGNLIRPEWYSFAGHLIDSYVQTAYDDCGIPHLTKSTVVRSTVADMKPMPGSRFFFKVYAADANWTDLGASGNVVPDFSVWAFDSLSFQQDVHTISTVHERTRKWSRKMYRVYSGGFCQPFGIYKISYRYTVAGRIRQ